MILGVDSLGRWSTLRRESATPARRRAGVALPHWRSAPGSARFSFGE